MLIRYAALASLVTDVVLLGSVLVSPKTHFPTPVGALGVLAMVLMYSYALAMPVFYFALYRADIALAFPARLRSLIGGTIVVATIGWVADIIRQTTNLNPGTTMTMSGYFYLSLLFTAAQLFLLVSLVLARDVGQDAPIEAPQLLAVATRVAVVGWALLAFFVCVSFVVALVTLAKMPAGNPGPRGPSAWQIGESVLRTLLSVGTQAAPFFVWLRIRGAGAKGAEPDRDPAIAVQ